MPPEPIRPVYVRTHIHTDGPIPGPHSLLSVTAVMTTERGAAIGTFTASVRELLGATVHPVALHHWRQRPDDWLTTHRGSRPPAVAMAAFARWTEQRPGATVFVADPNEPDYLFLYWYLQRFLGRWPFARTDTDAALRDRLVVAPPCPLTGCRSLAKAG